MFPRRHRLESADIRTVLSRGRRLQGTLMTVVSDLSGHPVPRFAVLVGKRVDKRASRRNRMKRLVRESVRLLLPAIGPGCDAIFLVNANIAQMTIGEVSSEVRNLLKDIGAIRTDL